MTMQDNAAHLMKRLKRRCITAVPTAVTELAATARGQGDFSSPAFPNTPVFAIRVVTTRTEQPTHRHCAVP